MDIDNAWITEAARAMYPNAKATTIDRHLVTPVSAVYNRAAEDQLCPPRRFRKRGKDNARIDWLTPEEAERLIKAIRVHQPHILRPVAIMLSGGARTGETFPITREALNIPTGEIWIPETKNDEPRYLRLPRRGLDMVLEGDLPQTGPICRTHHGKAYAVSAYRGSQIRAAWKMARKKAKLGPEITPHVLRHTWATWYYAATKDFGGLMDLGGWKTPSVANRYRKLAPEDLPERLLAHDWDFSRADYRPQSVVPFRAQARG
ncbi:MAG: site-specific integrase [Pseudomonadota bacterium]